jgi:hypothetical protein
MVAAKSRTIGLTNKKPASTWPLENGSVASGSGRGMVMMPRMHTQAKRMAVRMRMVQRMTMP